jgi:hypothetical protein
MELIDGFFDGWLDDVYRRLPLHRCIVPTHPFPLFRGLYCTQNGLFSNHGLGETFAVRGGPVLEEPVCGLSLPFATATARDSSNLLGATGAYGRKPFRAWFICNLDYSATLWPSSQARLVRPQQACIGVRKYSTRRTRVPVLYLTSDAGELALVRATLRRPCQQIPSIDISKYSLSSGGCVEREAIAVELESAPTRVAVRGLA